MNREEVEAVLGHEIAHVANGDMVTLTLIQGVVNTFVVFLARIVGFEGRFVFDPSKPDGTPRKLLDVAKLSALGWHYQTDLEDGIRQTYDRYRQAATERCGP